MDGISTASAIYKLVTEALEQAGRTVVIGICGAQGSGKSTVSTTVADRLAEAGHSVAVLSLDDLYLSQTDRQLLAKRVHPLFATRGVPGTHDVALGIDVIRRLVSGQAVALPRFNKATDNPFPGDEWAIAAPPVDVVLFEGWCIAAMPQAEADLTLPVNDLEKNEDPDAVWRTHANAQLAGPYQELFKLVDRLVLLAAPSFDVVAGWRRQQEEGLRNSLRPHERSTTLAMSDSQIERFVQHYERLTRHILAEMSTRADLVVQLDNDRRPVSIVQAKR